MNIIGNTVCIFSNLDSEIEFWYPDNYDEIKMELKGASIGLIHRLPWKTSKYRWYQ